MKIEIILPSAGYTFHELRYEVQRLSSRSVPESTLRRWIDKVCLIGAKDLYSAEDLRLIVEWTFFKERCRSVKTFQSFIFQEQVNADEDRQTINV